MEFYDMIAQVLGIAAMACNTLSYQQRTQKRVIGFQFFGSVLFALNYLMLGAVSGGILSVIGILRALVYMDKERFHAERPGWLFGFLCAYLVSYVLTFTVFGKEATLRNLILEFLPVIGITLTTISFTLKDARGIRRLGLIGTPFWLVYSIANQSIGAIISGVLSLASILIGILRLDRKKDDTQ